jgi:hypothetical protein
MLGSRSMSITTIIRISAMCVIPEFARRISGIHLKYWRPMDPGSAPGMTALNVRAAINPLTPPVTSSAVVSRISVA